MATDSESDSEFDKFLQESVSSTVSSVSGFQLSRSKLKEDERKENKGGRTYGGEGTISSLGLSWLKNTSPPPVANDNDTDEWINEQTNKDISRPTTSNKRKTSTTSVTDDPLNFSTGSSYSIISEIEHQLGLRGNKTTPPGQDTLNEEEEKKQFFELLEKGRGSSLDYSELNRQLDGSLRTTDHILSKTLKTIDEDVTPLVSSENSSPNHSLVISEPTNLPKNNILLSSTSSLSTAGTISKHSPLHDPTPLSTSITKLIPIKDQSKLTSKGKTTPVPPPTTTTTGTILSTTLTSCTNNNEPVINNEQSLGDNSSKSFLSSSFSDVTLPSPLAKGTISQSQSDSFIKPLPDDRSSGEPLLQTVSQSISTKSFDNMPLQILSDNRQEDHQPTAGILKHQPPFKDQNSPQKQGHTKSSSSIIQATTSLPSMLQSSSSTSDHCIPIASSTIMPLPYSSSTNILPTTTASNAPFVPLTNTALTNTAPTALTNTVSNSTKTLTNTSTTVHTNIRPSNTLTTSTLPITRSGTLSTNSKPIHSTTTTATSIGRGKESLQDLLRAMTVEELTSSTRDMITKQDFLPPPPPIKPSTHSSSLLNQDDVQVLHKQVEEWKRAWEKEKEKVKEKEEEIKEHIRREEKLQLEYGQQIQSLRGELLEQRAKLRRVEMEKSKSRGGGDEQERLIQGYQKENERLYSELSLSNKEVKLMKTKLLEDNNKLATELANLKDKFESQEEVIRYLRQELEMTSSYNQKRQPILDDDPNNEKLQESYKKCQKLQSQVDNLIHANKELESQVIMLRNERGSPIVEKDEDYMSAIEVNSMKQKYEKDIILLHEKLKKISKEYENVKEKYELLLKEKDEKTLIKEERHFKSDTSQKKGPHLIKSRTAADSRRIKDLEQQVHELQTALKKRHPNSIPALIYATNDTSSSNSKEEIVSYLENKVLRLESELTKREDEVALRIDEMKKQFNEMEALYEEQIKALKEQLTTMTHNSNKRQITPLVTTGDSSDDNDTIQKENIQLKEQISHLTMELTHLKLQLQGLTAQNEGEKRKSREKWEHKIKKIEKEHKEKTDTLVANLIQERSDSNIARLKSRLASRDARIKQLEDEIEICRIDGETLAVSKALEHDLRSQIETLTRQLEESKMHHTPEMHHFNSLLAKIAHLESNLSEYQRKLQESKDKVGLISQEELKQIELKYKRQLSAKNKQIEKFREELDSLMDTLHSLQENCTEVVPVKR